MTPIPPDNNPDSNVFCFVALADKQQVTLYINARGALPAMSICTNQYYFIAYDYDTNYIFTEPITDIKYETISRAFQRIFDTLVKK